MFGRRYNDKQKKQKNILMLHTDVEYFLNGKNLKEFGVYVVSSEGLLGQLERKEVLTVSWDSHHGVIRDDAPPRYKERTITLTCMLEADGRADFVGKVGRFFSLFEKAGTHRLKVEYDGESKPLVYEVALMSSVDVSKRWGQYDNDKMVGTFKVKLVEDEPVKRILRHRSTSPNSMASITVTSEKALNIYWGDGKHSYNIHGTKKLVVHSYASPGVYEIIVTGVIEDIEALTSNAVVIWDILK